MFGRVAPATPARPRLGAHMSIAGGLAMALHRGKQLGCETVQLFVKNQRQWRVDPLGSREVADFHLARRQTQIAPVVAHGGYLINLASPDERLWRRSIEATIAELRRCRRLGIDRFVIHPGSHIGTGVTAGITRIVQAINRIHHRLNDADGEVRLLLETTAGQGSSIGHAFEQLAEILASATHPNRLGVCLDSCHIFAAGYDIRTPRAYNRTMCQLEKIIGFNKIHCVHLNDSKAPLGGRVDRHEHIGRGRIGLQGFALLLNDPRLVKLPMILETPKGTSRGRDLDSVNLQTLRSLIKN